MINESRKISIIEKPYPLEGVGVRSL